MEQSKLIQPTTQTSMTLIRVLKLKRVERGGASRYTINKWFKAWDWCKKDRWYDNNSYNQAKHNQKNFLKHPVYTYGLKESLTARLE